MLNDFTSLAGSSSNKPLGMEGSTGRGALGAPKPAKIPVGGPTLNQGRSKVKKPVSRSGQAMQPGSHKKQRGNLGKQLSANYPSSNGNSKLFQNLKNEFGDGKTKNGRTAADNRVKKIGQQKTMIAMPGSSSGLMCLGNSDDYDDVPDPKDC